MKVEEKRLRWTSEIPADQWSVYQRVIIEAKRREIPFALGGALALATYSGNWRNTKDLDFYVLPRDRHKLIEVLSHCGLGDLFDTLEYQRHWIYRGHCNDVIVDIIWQMANCRVEIDEAWLTRGPQIDLLGETVHIAPAEEMLWGKIYVMQRDRCDWPDIMNLIHGAGPDMDWEHLTRRLGPDLPLLTAVLSLFSWLFPDRAMQLPPTLWARVNLPTPEPASNGSSRDRVQLLDSRPWFFAA